MLRCLTLGIILQTKHMECFQQSFHLQLGTSHELQDLGITQLVWIPTPWKYCSDMKYICVEKLKVHSSMNSHPEYSWRYWDALFRKYEICLYTVYTVHTVCTVLVFDLLFLCLGKTFTETIFTLSNITGGGQWNHRPPRLKRLGGKKCPSHGFDEWLLPALLISHWRSIIFRWYHRHKLKPCSFCSHTHERGRATIRWILKFYLEQVGPNPLSKDNVIICNKCVKRKSLSG